MTMTTAPKAAATQLEWLTEFFGAPKSEAERARLLALHTPESYAAFEPAIAPFSRPASLPELWDVVDGERAMG